MIDEHEAGNSPNVSQEEQGQYEDFVNRCYEMIYTDDNLEAIAATIEAGEYPAGDLAQAVAQVVSRVIAVAKEAGVEYGGDVKLHGGVEVMEAIADSLTQQGVYQFTPDDLERAMYIAMDAFRELNKNTGLINEDAAKEDMALLEQMDKSGSLEQQMSSLGAPEYLKGPVEAINKDPRIKGLGG